MEFMVARWALRLIISVFAPKYNKSTIPCCVPTARISPLCEYCIFTIGDLVFAISFYFSN